MPFFPGHYKAVELLQNQAPVEVMRMVCTMMDIEEYCSSSSSRCSRHSMIINSNEKLQL